MAQRQLARTYQSGVDTAVNWTTQATTTYDRNNPAQDPMTWGTAVEIGYLDRRFTATGNETTHLGLLATFVNKPDRTFYGAQVKVRPTYTGTANPFLECWTLLGTTWTLRRRVNVRAIARSGDTIVQDLTFDGLRAEDRPDAIWITLDTATDVSLTWLVCHLYGDCTSDPVTPDCPPGVDPEDCNVPECSADPTDFICTPIPLPPDLPPTDPFPFPPILIDIGMPTTYVLEDDGSYSHACPGPTGIRMTFGELPTGGSVVVTLVDAAGLVFAEGTQQTISAPGVMNWTISQGYGPLNPNIGSGSALGYLPPREVTDHVTFSFTRKAASPFTLLDILVYFWTYDLVYEELCYTDGPPVDGLPPADDPPDDAPEVPATFTLVFEQWFVYADTQARADAAQAAEANRQAQWANLAGATGEFLDYGLSRAVTHPGISSDAELFRAALAATGPYLDPIYDPGVCSSFNRTSLVLNFQNLADTHLITLRTFVVPVADLLRASIYSGRLVLPPATLNPFRNGAKILPYNPTPNVDTVICSPGTSPFDTQSGDLNQRLRILRNFTLTPQITKYGGTAVQDGAYHLVRGTTEDPSFDEIGIQPQPVPTNPFATTWTPPCVIPTNGRCYQWYRDGYAYLVTVRVYEPTVMPIGATVSIAAPNAFALIARQLLGAVTELDATWP